MSNLRFCFMLTLGVAVLSTAPTCFAQKIKYIAPKKSMPAHFYVLSPEMQGVIRASAWENYAQTTAQTRQRLQEELKAAASPEILQPAALQHPLGVFSGPNVLEKLMPGWQTQLKDTFDEAQLIAIKNCFKKTDQELFYLTPDGAWKAPRANEWRYALVFRKNLEAQAVSFRPDQYTRLFGKFSILDRVFTPLHERAFWLVHKRAPQTDAPDMAEKQLANHLQYIKYNHYSSMSAEARGYVYGQNSTPAAPNRSGHKQHAPKRTADEVLAQVQEFVDKNGRLPLASKESENSLRRAFDGACNKAEAKNLTDATSKDLLKLRDQYVKNYEAPRSAADVLKDVNDFITQNKRFPLQRAENKAEKSLRAAFDTACKKIEEQRLTDDTSNNLLQLKEKYVREIEARRSAGDILKLVNEFIENNKRFPSNYTKDKAEESLRGAFDQVCQKIEEKGLSDDTSNDLLQLRDQYVQKYESPRSAEDILKLVNEFIEKNRRFPSQYTKEEKSLRRAFDYACKKIEEQHLTDDTSNNLLTLRDLYVQNYEAPRSAAEVLTQVNAFITKYKRFPSSHAKDKTEKSLRFAFNNACKKIEKKNLTDDISNDLLALKAKYVKTINRR